MTYTSHPPPSWSRWNTSGLLVLLILSAWAQATTVAYCSSDLADAWAYTSSIYMSNGKCITNCNGYAFAVLQGDDCWCTNYVPASSVSTSSCNSACPGWPDDTCGNPSQQLWAYILIGTPQGTASGSSSSTIPSSRSVSTSAPTTLTTASGTSSSGRSRSGSSVAPFTSVRVSILTSSVSSQSSAVPSVPSLTSQTLSAVDPSTATSSFSSPSPSPPPQSPSSSPSPTQVYTSIISVTGKVSTITVTPTAAQTSDSALGAGAGPTANSSGGGLSGGKVAGIVIGVAIAIGLIIGLIVFFWLRKRHRRNIDAISEGASFKSSSHASKNIIGGMPSRQVSQLSSAGLLARPNRAYTGGLSAGDDNRSAGGTIQSSDRNSTHMTVDQRLNPWAIYSNEDSRASNVSLQDNQDYSRQLRVANPDSRDA